MKMARSVIAVLSPLVMCSMLTSVPVTWRRTSVRLRQSVYTFAIIWQHAWQRTPLRRIVTR
jgi:hypothetical protein